MEETKYDIPIGIPEFYKGKSVLITGFTGYIGQLLVEKLLYSCPEIGKIYVLVRGKRGVTPQERAQKVMSSRSFKRIHEVNPESLKTKIAVIPGDLVEDRLGLSQEDEDTLKNNVSILIHGAATVRFDEPLNVAVKMNTVGTKRIAELALKLPHLICFTYISTAYSNCDNMYIKEELYPPKADWKKTIEITEKIDPATLQILERKYIGAMPNTYTFTKSLGEQVIVEYKDRLPVVIVRPSIVVSACKEPMPGWTGNKYGPGGIMMGYLIGILRCNFMVLHEKSNCIHSDIVVNATLIITWKTALTQKRDETRDITVYNVCEPPWYSVTNETYANIYSKPELIKAIDKDRINFISLKFSPTEIWYRINNLYRQVLPAYIIDFMLQLANKKPILLSVRRAIFNASLILSFFLTRTFHFDTDRFEKLNQELRPEDREAFSWDFSQYDVHDVYMCAFFEIQHTFIKPLYDDLETNRKRLLMLYCVDKSAVVLTYSLIAFLIYHFSIPQVLISAIISFFTLQ